MIWDFQVFSQVWIMRNARPTSDYFLISIYSFVESFNASEYGLGSAIAVVMVLAMLGATFVYIRQMVRIGEVRSEHPSRRRPRRRVVVRRRRVGVVRRIGAQPARPRSSSR